MKSKQTKSEPNSKYHEGSSSLHFLVQRNDYELARIFLHNEERELLNDDVLGRNYDFRSKDSYGRNPCDLAIELGHKQILELYQRYGGYAQV